MNNQLKFPRFTIGFALLAVLMLSSCGKKSEAPTASNETSPATTTASSSAPATDTSGSAAGKADSQGVKPNGTTCPSDSPVKGKDTKKRGKIYIVSKSPDYAKSPVDLCFKDTASAEKAGYKAPK
jgi:hypothetical protein